MASQVQQAAFRRRIIYGTLIFVLFGLSMFWRGKLDVPLSSSVPLMRWLSNQSIQAQAEKLELRELDKGDPEIAGATARLACVGARGFVVSALWYAAIQKQKRNEFYEFEIYARSVTRLQPNFITPWVFQSWNIAYNVSVENDKLGDMFFYIARGIELLAEGDRYNSKRYIDDKGREMKIGSPDMRYQIGFYYQNKFSVSDKVSTLRSLMQLACIAPPDRRKAQFLRNDQVDLIAFQKFCEANPQLVRRLRNKLNCQQPSEVIQFLGDNETIPSLYSQEGTLFSPETQFPILPEKFDEDEFYPNKPVNDSFDAFHAARAWFRYSLLVIPPPKVDSKGEPLAWRAPSPGEYDAIRYRMPRAPALHLFRQQAPRAQTYLADRLATEGWFDKTSAWDPDEFSGPSTRWFPATNEPVLLRAQSGSQQEWERAFALWDEHGERNAMKLSESRRYALMQTAGVQGMPNGILPDRLKDLEESGQKDRVEAHNSLVYYEQNRANANYFYFLETANAEKDPVTIAARKLLWEADQSRQNGRNNLAISQYRAAMSKWRQVLEKYKDFHRPYNSTKNEEDTFENELKLIGLLKEDGLVRERARKVSDAAQALLGTVPLRTFDDYLQGVAEDEAGLQITTEAMRSIWPSQSFTVDEPRAKALTQSNNLLNTAGALGAVFAVPQVVEDINQRGIINSKFSWMKDMKAEPVIVDGNREAQSYLYWVRPELRDQIKERLGLQRKIPVAPAPGGDPAAMPGPGGPGGPAARQAVMPPTP
ncbi:MAG: hypothetical protein ACRC8S_03410 [Fimbriiglobus sp.]